MHLMSCDCGGLYAAKSQEIETAISISTLQEIGNHERFLLCFRNFMGFSFFEIRTQRAAI